MEYKFLWDSYKRTSGSARRQGNFVKASRVLKEAFRDCEEYRELDPELIDIAHDLAESHLAQGKFAEAESMLRAVLEVREKLLGQTHADVVESLKRVAIVQIMAFRAEALGRNAVATTFGANQPISISTSSPSTNTLYA
jgi:hypothetical protein